MLNSTAFNDRHEFDDSDIEILKERWPGINFQKIPSAWIVSIDEMLSAMRYDNPIYEIRQEFGHLIILSKPLKPNQKLIIEQVEKALYLIDADLHIYEVADNKTLN